MNKDRIGGQVGDTIQALGNLKRNAYDDLPYDERTYPKHLGTGKQQVYLYYYRTYRENAERKRDPV